MPARDREPRTVEPPLASAALLKDVMAAHFAGVDRAAREKTAPVAWCTSVGPVELLRALGYEVFFPENHGAMLGASRMAGETMGRAHALGYSPDICSYLTSDIGSYIKGESPIRKMNLPGPPKADVLVYNTNQCRDVKDWFQFYAREWGVPCIGIHSPRAAGELDGAMIKGVARQIEHLIEPLEKVAGQKLDIDRLREVIGSSRRCTRPRGPTARGRSGTTASRRRTCG